MVILSWAQLGPLEREEEDACEGLKINVVDQNTPTFRSPFCEWRCGAPRQTNSVSQSTVDTEESPWIKEKT